MKKKEVEPKSGIPFIMIGGVLIAVLIVAWYWIGSSNKPAPANRAANTANTANTAKTSQIPTNAPLGAQPPNQSGSPTASVTIEEFADFQCGSCAMANPIMNEIKSMYGSRIRFIFRNYPLSIPAHDKAYDAAVAAEAAGNQGKFWDMQNLLFTNQQTWTTNPNYKQLWKEYAQRIGLDIAKYENDVVGIGSKGRVDLDLQRGRALGVSSTPTVYVNGISIPFNEMKVESLKLIIDGELQKAATANKPEAAPANTNK